MSEWAPVLDRLERQLRQQESAFRKGTPIPTGLQLEGPAEPMTPAESVRAAALLQRTDALLDETVVFVRARRQVPTPYGP